jgi:hypothetical protein
MTKEIVTGEWGYWSDTFCSGVLHGEGRGV